MTAGEVTKRFPYFGDLHVHTSWSLDSYVNFNRVGPRDAYRFAGGEPVVLSGGRVVRIDRPLDFAAVTEHAEYLGELPLCTDETGDRYSLELCRDIRNETGQQSYIDKIFRELIIRDVLSPDPQREPALCGADNSRCLTRAKSTWRELQEIAHEFNRPGSFTTFVGYEWTGNTSGNNLHRNVIYGNEHVPALPIGYFEANTPAIKAFSPSRMKGSGGLAGVWAEQNTRAAIFAALKRRETFATSGTRITVRFFAGWNFPDKIDGSTDLAALGYARGVPMGGDLPAPDNATAPGFILWAMKDPQGVNLQRIQVIKGWLEQGKSREQVYDVACSDGLVPDPDTNRCPDNGASVNPEDCSVSTEQGAVELKSQWRDPDFDAQQHAFYYLRVLENPSCRWSTWEALREGNKPFKDVDLTIQERAWSSPIWYGP